MSIRPRARAAYGTLGILAAVVATAVAAPASAASSTNTLTNGEILAPSTELTSQSGEYRLRMSPSGSLILYGAEDTILWKDSTFLGEDGVYAKLGYNGKFAIWDGPNGHAVSDSAAGAGATLTLQNNGNLVLRDGDSTVEWHLGTARDSSRLQVGDKLESGESLLSPNGDVELRMQANGKLVAYSKTDGVLGVLSDTEVAGAFALMQSNGNLSVRTASGQVVWHADQAGSNAVAVSARNDGSIALIDAGGAIVATLSEAPIAHAPIPSTNSQSYSNGEIPKSSLCAIWWDTGERLRCDATQALHELNNAYRARFGSSITVNDSYRSYAEQVAIKSSMGNLAATPGTSNHGWGVAVDLGGMTTTGGQTCNYSAKYLWLKANAPAYGWNQPSWALCGGSKLEPWHWEFSG